MRPSFLKTDHGSASHSLNRKRMVKPLNVGVDDGCEFVSCDVLVERFAKIIDKLIDDQSHLIDSRLRHGNGNMSAVGCHVESKMWSCSRGIV